MTEAIDPQAAHDVLTKVRSALTRFRVLAFATGVFLILLTFNIVWKYVLGNESLGAWIGQIHGWLYLAYLMVTLDLWFKTRLPWIPTVGVAMAGTIPVMSFVAERWVTPRVEQMLDQAQAQLESRSAGAE